MPALKKAKKNKVTKANLNASQIRDKLKLKHLRVSSKLSEVHPHVDKFFKEKNLDPGKIRDHSSKVLSAGALAGALILNPPTDIKALPPPHELYEKYKVQKKVAEVKHKEDIVVDAFSQVLPKRPRPLTRYEEKYLEQVFKDVLGVSTKATLEGEHLNTTYGFIGAEQHLRRFPGDTLSQHGEGVVLKEGMAPGLGAWGYFAKNKDELTPELSETEKWYAVVQTLYLPDWNVRTRHLRDWYKYRKVLIADVDSGRAVVASIADSGPAAWTGKHFGGSPEVMDYLGGPKYKKGKVVLFFVDDPKNKIALGPVEYNELLLADVSI